jgi:hypothetical protein
MERRYFNVATLRGELDELERRHGVSSEVAYAEYAERNQPPTGVDPWEIFVWADTYREWRRLSGRADAG